MSTLLSEVERPSSQKRALSGTDDLQGFDGPGESPRVSPSLETTTPTPSGGIAIECLDTSLLQALSCLFPKDRGRSFVASLLRTAVIKQVDLPEVGRVDVAVVILKSIEAFARQHGYSKDRALRYVDILEALQIVRRSRHADSTELLLPLVAWTPTSQALCALDALLADSAARAKLQQLAGTVKTRFFLLYGSPHSWSSLLEDLHETLTDVQALLDKRITPSKRSLLQLRLANLKRRLEAEGAKGDRWNGQQEAFAFERAEKGDLYAGPAGLQSPAATQKGDFQYPPGRENGSRMTQKGDREGRSSELSSPAFAQKGDVHTGPGDTTARTPPEKGDLFHQEQTEKGDVHLRPRSQNEHHQTQKGDFQQDSPVGSAGKGDFQGQSGRHVAQKGDFQGEAPGLSFNENVIHLSLDSEMRDVLANDATKASALCPLEDRYTKQEAVTVGLQLAMFLEQTSANVGGFVNKCKVCTRTTIRAAVIDTLVHTCFPTVDPADGRGRPQSRAAWFHAACNHYTKPDASIPVFVQRWLKTDLSWEEIEQALREAATGYARYMMANGRTADLVRRWLRGELTDQALDEALQSEAVRVPDAPLRMQTDDHSLERPTRSKSHLTRSDREQHTKDWMGEGEAEELARRILQEAGPLGVTLAVAKQESGRGVYLVELVWDGYRMAMRSPQAWEKHLAGVLRSRQLQQQYLRERAERGEKHGTTQ